MQISVSGSSGRPMTSMGSPRRTPSASLSGAGLQSAVSMQAPLRSSSAGVQSSQLTQHMAQSMTIDEMRALHQRALTDAESKRTELRLVLASRYRELVGSSDEVIKMKERSSELHDLVIALPQLASKLLNSIEFKESKQVDENDNADDPSIVIDSQTEYLRMELALLPRVMYRALDAQDVFKATTTLIQLLTLISQQTDDYPLANALSQVVSRNSFPSLEPTLEVMIRTTYWHIQALPNKIRRTCSGVLARAASYGILDPSRGVRQSGEALASLHLLQSKSRDDSTDLLLTTYFDLKAKLLVSLLNQLTIEDASNAEVILSKIVLILQQDVVMHSYQIFFLRRFPDSKRTMSALPIFDKGAVKIKCSKFLAAHLPLIRTKVKSVLITIAGTTASALGQIRQSLYDKTDGTDSIERLNESGICTWDEAIMSMIDSRTVFADGDVSQQNRFSLWGSLFSNTFSSLVHSLLTTSFQSVHTSVVVTLRNALASSPPLTSVLPHEAYRNTLKIASDLDLSLLKVSEDAHELLVHAEERFESERRLRQSLYVQTCEIMGRLICELRRMTFRSITDRSDATKELIVGRLCFLLKFRLSSLRALLSSDSSAASMNNTSGMISLVDLQSSFDLADDDEDGLITFEEAVEAVESAFSGSPFHGAEMVRETLLLSSDGKETSMGHIASSPELPTNVTLNELTLLTARGLRHEESRALNAVQLSLDNIVQESLKRWAKSTMAMSESVLKERISNFVATAPDVPDVPDEEWVRMFAGSTSSCTSTCPSVSPYWVGYLLDVVSVLNGSTSPSDCMSPAPSLEYASSLGNVVDNTGAVSTFMDILRRAIVSESLEAAVGFLHDTILSGSGGVLSGCGVASLIQLHVDVSFIKYIYLKCDEAFSNTTYKTDNEQSLQSLEAVVRYSNEMLQKSHEHASIIDTMTSDRCARVLEASDLFFSSLFGDYSGRSALHARDLVEHANDTNHVYGPLTSSRRFTLLPVQADRSIDDIQIQATYAKDKGDSHEHRDVSSGNVISGGFGFLSNMLKTKNIQEVVPLPETDTDSILSNHRIDKTIESMKLSLRQQKYGTAIVEALADLDSYLMAGEPDWNERISDFITEYWSVFIFSVFVLVFGMAASREQRRHSEYARVASHLNELDKNRAEALQGRFQSTSCPICLENFQSKEEERIHESHGNERETLMRNGSDGLPLRLLRCGHVFDETCWDNWISSGQNGDANKCPICRQDISRSYDTPNAVGSSVESNTTGGISDSTHTESLIGSMEEDARLRSRAFRQYMHERNFRLVRLASRYPQYIRPQQLQSWTRVGYDGSLVRDPSFVSHDPARQLTSSSSMGGSKSRRSFGSGHGFGGGSSGGGRGGRW